MAPQNQFEGPNEPIAVIGTACRFPGDSTTPSKLWELLRDPRDILSEIPEDRFSARGFYHPDPLHHGTSNVRHSYLLSEDPKLFDAQFFGIKPVEANSIDPQQRLLIETVYESIEAAGLSIEDLRGTQAGVYVGLMCADYESMAGRDIDNAPTYYATGTARSIISNRISYFFDWHGPSMTIDTACSSSLVAVHQAVQLLRSGDGTDVAVAAGANLLLSPDLYIAESKLKMLSADGRSHMWDDRANGYARGDGVAVIVMKRLSQALKDGDHIDCIIRETQLNQDGKTKGITMPSAAAQASLIRATYKKAGLDISKRSDRPQFFEAHGTGTPAGDPIEAEAIYRAFFGDESVGEDIVDPLYVGSIKTVIGHTEGTAGLAALIKASLAIQNSTIPPNLLFKNLNPKVAPFYGPLEIATESRPWPKLEAGCVRRASVNSFGFGGSNAHAIIESAELYNTPSTSSSQLLTSSSNVSTPFNFSATTETSLRAILRKYANFLSQNDDINLRDLSWTLSQRRSTFPLRTSVYGSTALELSERLKARAEADEKVLKEVVSKSLPEKPRILGVFTGQGAQWARMGAELLGHTHVAVSILDSLEGYLAELPDGPSWSIKNEILAEGQSSRVYEAEISQPLCTAVQILLVDILASAGIIFAAVVGHSSGEIGAAYAAGYVSAKDAIRIAYYRGVHLHLSGGPNGEKGAMMAAGTSFQDAQDLCDMPELQGRINIAASNSFSSVTLSGDADAIEEAQGVLEDEKKFARLLKVDKAYHSHHMLPCSDAYMKSLVDCKIKVLRSRSGTTWISSVYNEDAANYRGILKDEYWLNNMVSPVMFSQAIEIAIAESGPFDIGIECGPHPALQGPVLQVIQEVLGEKIPYTGLLSRGKNDNQALAEALGYLWQALGDNAVDYGSVDKFLAGPYAAPLKMSLNLPSYAWDHDRVYLHESRQYGAYRTRPDASHELLGVSVPDGTREQLRWRNIVRPREVPWISGHQIQGQMVFPAAGYLSSVLSALQFAVDGNEMKLIEIEDFVIGQAMVFNDEYSSVETQFVLADIAKTDDSMTASFSFFSASTKDQSLMILNASGKVSVEFGSSHDGVLPENSANDYNMFDVDSELFYGTLTGLGFGYTGPFKALDDLRRKLGLATGVIKSPASTDHAYNLMLHPAALDAAIQSIILAYCYPDDGRMLSIHLPTSVSKIRINPSLCESIAGQETSLRFRSSIKDDRSADIDGDVEIYDERGEKCLVQLEGLHTKPLAHATAANDTRLFFKLGWDVEALNKETALSKMPNLEHQTQLSFDLERVAYYYLRNLDTQTTKADRENTEWHHKIFFEYIDHVLEGVRNGTAQFTDKKWMSDTYEQVQDLINKYPDHIGMKLMRAVGEHLVPVIRGETTVLQYMTEDNMLNEFYVSAVGFQEYTYSLAEQVGKLGHRYPHMNVLEIGAGTGGATKHVFRHVGDKFGSYTYTDISTGFFETAKDVFSAQKAKMIFRPLNIENDPIEQGFAEHSYDLIVASLVLHATREMEKTMLNVRRLLKPGGRLIMLEFVRDQMWSSIIFGPLPGWWMGYDEGRKLSPAMSTEAWDECLKKTGFSGADAVVPYQSDMPISLAVVSSQALDDKVNFLRSPLTPGSLKFTSPNLLIIGGNLDKVKQLANNCSNDLTCFYSAIQVVNSFEDLVSVQVPFMGTVLILSDLDEPMFKNMTTEKINGAKRLFEQSKTCLWVTKGAKDVDPFQNMSIGFGRTVNLEMPHLRLQFFTFLNPDEIKSHVISEKVLQLEAFDTWEQMGHQNLLWSVEPEIAYEKGNFLIPRIGPNPIRNDRYNSARRSIEKQVDSRDAILSLEWSGSGFEVREAVEEPVISAMSRETIKVDYATLQSIKITGNDYLYLVLGTNTRTKELVCALSTTRKTVVSTPSSWVMPLHESPEKALGFMPVLQTYLATLAAITEFSPGQTVVLLEPDHDLADIFSTVASQMGVQVVNLTVERHNKRPGWLSIHPNAPRRVVKSLLPNKIACFINNAKSTNLGSAILSCLSPETVVKDGNFWFAKEAQVDEISSLAFIPSAFRSAWVRAHQCTCATVKPSVFAADQLSSENQPTGDISLFQWPTTPMIPVKVSPIDSQDLFSPNKTYWLVGLSGGLGLSLCNWMVEHGAKFVVITSRNPKVDPAWMTDIEARGAVIKVIANDITNRDSVRSVYKKICDELPPVGGVAQGAMVLQDTMISDLDLDRVQNVLRPKVDGSIYLDEIFSETPLEFFIFFSSSVYVIGNRGQSIYAAANGYMTALAAQRRKRNLAGSVIHIGAIVGNGYVTRELNLEQVKFLKRVGNLLMSEQDFHQIFAEGIMAGCEVLDHTSTPEVYTGLRRAYVGDADQPGWSENPQFSHCVSMPDIEGGVGSATKQNISVKAQLLTATTPEEVQEIIQESFVDKLKSTLQTDSSLSILEKHTDELGIDSLVAVDIRSWFIKELNVEMPILKILGGFTAAELVTEAREKIPESLVPNLGKEVDEALKSAAKMQRAAPVVERKIVPKENNFKDFDEEDDDEEQERTIPTIQVPNYNAAGDTRELKFSSSSSDSSKDGGVDSTPTPALSSTTSADLSYSKLSDGIYERVVPMSFGQSRFWFLKHYLTDPTTFNIITSVRLDGPLVIDRFSRAVRTVAAHHEALRTAFFTSKDNQGMQGILRISPLYLEHRNIKNTVEVDLEYERIRKYEYDLARGELMKIVILSLSKTQHFMLIGYHHINMDGMSLEVLVADLQHCYYGTRLPAVTQYPDFAAQQLKQYSRGQWQQEILYWKSEFATIPPPLPILPLSAKKTRSSLTSYNFNNARFRIDSSTTAQIQNACRKTGSSVFHFFLATFKALLQRYTGDEDDICIGMADGGRNNDDVASSIGFFLNLLPLRFKAGSSQTFNDALKESRSKVVAALQNSAVPFDIILNEINAPRSTTHNPLFQAFINYRPGISEKRQYCGCESEATDYDSSQTAYDLSIDVIDNSGGGALVVVQGQSDLYSQSNVDTMADSYLALLKAFAKFPAARLSRPALYDAKATEHAIKLGRGPLRASAWPQTLVHRIDDITQKFGSNIALKCGSSMLTYSEMSERINSIATSLTSRQLGSDSRIGVFQEPSTDLYCSLLAVLRIGAILIPLEPRLTPPRIALIVQDSAIDAVVFDTANKKDISAISSTFFKKVDVSMIPTKASTQVANSAIGNNTAIIMYTSGTTGAPKGILLRHSGWVNQTESASGIWKPSFGSGVHLQSSSWSFDMSLSQTFLALCNGATLLGVPKAKHGDSLAIGKMIVSENVTVTHATPWEYVNWISSNDRESLQQSQWTIAITAGEKPSHAQLREFRQLAKQDLKLFNLYGPTEITFGMGSANIDYHNSNDLETPQTLFSNYSIYILDSKMQPVPVGIPGEIYVGGAGIAEGYLNNESLSDERFPNDPFAPAEYLENNWLRMHKSGDRGRLSANGALIVEGRVEGDTQIKLRGIRIDLRDIESTILQQSGGNIKDSIVSFRKADSGGDDGFLVAHAVMSSRFSGPPEGFLETLRLSLPLPQYMQPAMMIALDSFPINNSRKVDRRAISTIPLSPAKQSSSVPQSTASQPQQSSKIRLEDLWEQVLGTEITSQYRIDETSNFFHVGGSSSGLIGLQSLIKKTFGVEVALVHLFENPTLGGMMKKIDPTPNISEHRVVEVAAPTSVPVVEKRQPEVSATDFIDWDVETAVPNDLYELEMQSSPKEIDIPFKNVIITGSTGFLGKELLIRMVADESIEKIHVIAVRKRISDLPAIFLDPKVKIHRGDLAAPRLGLSENTAQEIFSLADSVIHNGADVSFLKTYRTLERSNVQSTRELVKLCLPHRLPFHFISSSGVAHLTNSESVGEESLAAFEPPTDGSDGYTATKWASERFLELVGEKFSMPIYIHRPSSITGDGAPAMDLMTNMLAYSKRMRKTPASSTWAGVLDFVSVEHVAEAILNEVHNEGQSSVGMVKYLHQSGDLEIPITDMQESLERETGESFESLSVEQWVRAATKEGMSELIGEYLVSAADLPITFPKLLKNWRPETKADLEVQQAPSSWFTLKWW